MRINDYLVSYELGIQAGGPGSGCQGPNCGRHSVGGAKPLRPPTAREMQHEKMRINNAGGDESVLHRRLDKMTKPQKLYAFHLALEDENYHDFNSQHVEPKLKSMGYNMRTMKRPKTPLGNAWEGQ